MDQEPNVDNVVYIDEYPELQKKVWLNRLHRSRLGQLALFGEDTGQLLLFETVDVEPDDIA